MPKECRWVVCLIVLFFARQHISSQPLRSSDGRFLPDTVSVGFERVLNTFVLSGDLGLVVADSEASLAVRQSVQSRLIRSDPVSSQGEYDGFVGYRKRVSGGWNILAKASSLVVSDNRSIDLDRLAQHQGFIGMGFTSNQWDLGLLGGYELNAQENERDRGPALNASAVGTGLRFQEIQATIHSDWSKSYLGRRSPEEQNVALGFGRNFGEGTTDSLVLRYSKLRREFYTAADPGLNALYSIDHNIFRRDAVSFEIADQLSYSLSPQSRITAMGSIQNRTIDRGFLYRNYLQPSSITLDSKIQELFVNGRVTVSSQLFNWLFGEAGMAFQERDERYNVIEDNGVPLTITESQEQSARRLEYTSRRTSMWGSVKSGISSEDSLSLSGSASILRYDTPDSLNTDDRDELLLTFVLEETHRFNQYLIAGLAVSATLSHLVYIDRLQSANNNWNRVLSFSPRIVLRPTRWLISDNYGEVVANYTVYDFEEQVASVKSFSFRQASWTDSTGLTLNKHIEFGFSGTLRVYERGILKWKEFKEKPLDYFVEKSIWPRLYYRALENLSLSVGYRYFSQYRYSYEGEVRNLTGTIVTSGPTVGVEWIGINGVTLFLNGWRETFMTDSQVTSVVPNLSVSASWMF